MLRQIQSDLREAGSLESTPFDDECNFWPGHADAHEEMLGPTWADDSAFVASDSEPLRLLEKLTQLASSVIDAASDYGLEPNFRKGKTEIMATFRERAARQFRPKSSETESEASNSVPRSGVR